MKKVKLIFLLLTLIPWIVIQAQTLPDIQKIKVDELSDAQITSMLQQAAARGYGPQQVIQIAGMQGMPASETSKLSQRISSIAVQQSSRENLTEQLRKSPVPEAKGAAEKIEVTSNPFGYSIFNDDSKVPSFETDLNIPTPEGYIIGPGDQLQITIHGASERTFSPVVDKEGNITLQNIGPVQVSGLTLESAKSKVKGRLAVFYTDLNSNGSTYLYFSVAKIRTIKVNLVGEIKRPGTYTVNGLSTVMNSLYVTGGPTDLGTMRDIRVYRDNKLVGTFDVYEYILNGRTKANIRLKNDDVIMVGPYVNRVYISGEVKRPGIYELLPKENVSDALRFTGGFSPNAYKKAVFIERLTSTDKQVVDVMERQFDFVNLMAGDRLEIRSVIDRFQNRLFIKGAVFMPGRYELKLGMTLGQLIKQAEGARGDADLNRLMVTRTNDDFTTATLTLDLNAPGVSDFLLEPEDIVQIPSKYDLAEETYVEISGEVNAPGIYRYSDSLSAAELVIKAGGFLPSANKSEVEVVSTSSVGDVNTSKFLLAAEADKTAQTEQLLKPFDHLIIRKNPDFVERRSVQLVGEVNNPGIFYLTEKNQTLSDVLAEAGGLKETAFLKGASLIRQTEYFPEKNERQQRYEDLRSITNKYDSLKLTSADQSYLDQVWQEIWVYDNVPSPDQVFAQAKRDRLQELAESNPFVSSLKVKREESIPLNLEEVMKAQGTSNDPKLQNGDIIFIPKVQSTVRLRGNVLYPNTVSYSPGKSFKYYINEAGGFDVRSLRRNTYVVYANGSVDRTRAFLFFKKYPKVEPGSEIIVPTKPVKIPVNPGQLISISSGLTAMVAVIIQLINSTNP